MLEFLFIWFKLINPYFKIFYKNFLTLILWAPFKPNGGGLPAGPGHSALLPRVALAAQGRARQG